MNNLSMNTKIRRKIILKTKYKVMILTGSLLAIAFCVWNMWNIGTVQAQTLITTPVKVATAGDAGFLTTSRNINDLYNVLVLIAIELMFWIVWNIVRTVSRILTDFRKF